MNIKDFAILRLCEKYSSIADQMKKEGLDLKNTFVDSLLNKPVDLFEIRKLQSDLFLADELEKTKKLFEVKQLNAYKLIIEPLPLSRYLYLAH